MSKTRNPEQKARRAYLDMCRKQGKKPLDMKAWKAEADKALAKAKKAVAKIKAKAEKKADVKKPVKAPAKKPVRAKVHEVRKGDVIKFIDFEPSRIIKYAMRLLCMATSEVCK